MNKAKPIMLIKFGPIAVAQALTPIFGEHRAMEAARETPLHTSPEWQTLEYQIEKATKRAVKMVENEKEMAEQEASILDDEISTREHRAEKLSRDIEDLAKLLHSIKDEIKETR